MAEVLLLHPKTQKQASRVIKAPPQALLIHGPAGSGKQALAEYVAAALLAIPVEKLANYPYFLLLQKPDNKQEISIDTVREVIRQLQLKAVIGGNRPVKRVVLIDGAHLLSAEAQNALLKAIEEPPPGTNFILTAASDTAVLPTIASRTEKLALIPVGSSEAERYFENQHAKADINSAWSLSGGAAGLLWALLQEDNQHPLKRAVETAKNILSLSRYDRLLFMDGLSADKNQFGEVLDALSRVLAALHYAAINSGNAKQAKKLITARKLVNSTISSLQNNASARLLTLNLALKLPV